MLLATTLVRPAFAEDLAKPSNTGGEKVKAPQSAPTSSAKPTKSAPVADVKDGKDLVGLVNIYTDGILGIETNLQSPGCLPLLICRSLCTDCRLVMIVE